MHLKVASSKNATEREKCLKAKPIPQSDNISKQKYDGLKQYKISSPSDIPPISIVSVLFNGFERLINCQVLAQC
jgi:hypothetical protein